MTRLPAQRRLAVRLATFALALVALPLMAPTCGTPDEGAKVFAKGSLIIPMDVCYQYQTDGVRTAYTPSACPQAVDPGSVIRAYGLVYQLIRRGIAVYWIIDNAKVAVDGVDLSVQYNGGFPVHLYDWATGVTSLSAGTPTAGHAIDYRGGPFVVDGSDAVRASQAMQAVKSTFSGVNVHVSEVAFKGYAKRTMAGGWSAGGAIPPKLALLDIGSSGAGTKNSEVVIQGYLQQAGLDTPLAGGTSGAGSHGEIYDKLLMPDFIPTAANGDWRTTRLFRNGYQILWVPHWAAPTSCSDCPSGGTCTCQNKYDPVTISSALKTIGQFVANGGDLFAECAGLGSFEGVLNNPAGTGTGYDPTYVVSPRAGPEPTTEFQTAGTPGFWIETNTPSGAYLWPGNFNSPFMQLGDYPFIPQSGAISDYRPSAYRTGGGLDDTVKLVSETSTVPGFDIFTVRNRKDARGTIVYLGGHSYSGTDGKFVVAGSRLVLNTLFNLGAGCTATGVKCSTGLLGVCAVGTYQCQGGLPVCVPDVQPGTRGETCNGLDDNCNGEVDENLTTNCYEAPAGYADPLGRTGDPFLATSTVGVCRSGVSSCVQRQDGSFGMSACVGQVLPSAETCNGLDDDCNGRVDDDPSTATSQLEQACYGGPLGTQNVGTCRGGGQLCQAGTWGARVNATFTPGACDGEVVPSVELCGNGLDDDCDGQVDEGCSCSNLDTQPCFTGPGTASLGACQAGSQSCESGTWGGCSGQIVASDPEPCQSVAAVFPSQAYEDRRALDTNCDGVIRRCPECNVGDVQSCYGDVPGTIPAAAGRGQCTWGSRACVNGKWAACAGYGRQSIGSNGLPIEYCDGFDNNCNGPRSASPHPGPGGAVVPAGPALTGVGTPPGTDDDAVCPPRFVCLNAVCVPEACGTELPPPDGYDCSSGHLVQGTCGGASCGLGQLCQYGTCVDPCPVSSTTLDPVTLHSASLVCGEGTSCGGGSCIGGGCYEVGCAAGELCQGGACVADPCQGLSCPSGTFCRRGDCVQSCAFVACGAGQICGADGFCVADACAGVTCDAGKRCLGGLCRADPCLGKSCAVGQVCDGSTGAALCVDDPCVGVTCPVGLCADGQCFPGAVKASVGAARTTVTEKTKGGCGWGSGEGAALPALLGLLLAPLARRRRAAGRGGGLALVLLAAAALAVAPGCKKKTTTEDLDLSGCAQTCGEQRCVDLTTDPSHCGLCVRTCGGGERCVDGTCGPAGGVAPFLSSLSPASGNKDAAVVTVALAGQRFLSGVKVRIAGAGDVLVQELPCPGADCDFLSATALRVHLDLGGVAEQGWTLRVVNPDLVISNGLAFVVKVPIPAIDHISPAGTLTGVATNVSVVPTGGAGTGFTSGSTCFFGVSKVPADLTTGRPLPSALQADGTLQCFLDASADPVGAYTVLVASEKAGTTCTSSTCSNAVQLTLSPADPIVFAVDPTAILTLAPYAADLRLTGAQFSQARVLFDGAPLGTTITFSPSTLLVTKLPMPATPGLHSLAVQNYVGGVETPPRSGIFVGGSPVGLPSNGVAFTAGNNAPPAVATFSPPVAYVGDPDITLQFTGTNLPSNSVIELEPAGASSFSVVLTPSTVLPGGCSTACTTFAAHQSFVGQPQGSWLARLRLGPPGSATSPPWSIQVLSNQAILRGFAAVPDPQQSGTVGSSKSSVTYQVGNIHGAGADFSGVKVWFEGPSDVQAQTRIVLSPSPAPNAASTSLTVPGLSLAGLEAGTYTFKVVNTGAVPSNALPFAVLPGPPRLDAVCLVQNGACAGQAAAQAGLVKVRLDGQNFARKDVSGNGSTVMVAHALSPNFPAIDPCGVVTTTGTQWSPAPVTSVTVIGSTRMEMYVDTTAAYVDPSYGTTYYVGVWNPASGSASAPLKTSCGKTVNQASFPTQWFKITP